MNNIYIHICFHNWSVFWVVRAAWWANVKCKNHNLVVSAFVSENLSSDYSDSESENLEAKFLWWSKNDGAAKVEVTLDVEDALNTWQETGVKTK